MSVTDGKWEKDYQLFSFINPVLYLVNTIFPLCFLHFTSLFLFLHICTWIYMYVYLCMCARMYLRTYSRYFLQFFLPTAQWFLLLTPPAKKAGTYFNANLAPDHARESAKAYIRMASSNNTNSSFSCSLFIGLDRQQESDTLFYS